MIPFLLNVTALWQNFTIHSPPRVLERNFLRGLFWQIGFGTQAPCSKAHGLCGICQWYVTYCECTNKICIWISIYNNVKVHNGLHCVRENFKEQEWLFWYVLKCCMHVHRHIKHVLEYNVSLHFVGIKARSSSKKNFFYKNTIVFYKKLYSMQPWTWT